MKRKQRILWIALSTVAVAALAFGIYVSNYYHATDVALDAFEAKDGIRVKSVDGVFCLETSGSTDGLVFYPGGKVQAEAYQLNLKKLYQGLISLLEFQTATGNYLRSQADEMKSLYEYLIKEAVVKYYNGIDYVNQ